MWVLVVLGLAYLIYSNQTSPQPRPGGRTYAVLGDSIGVGISSPFLRLARAAGEDGQSFAVESTTAAEWLSRGWVTPVASSGAFTDAIVSLGTNDANGNTPGDVLRSQFQQLADVLRGAGMRVYWQEPPTQALARAGEVRDIIRGLSGVTVVPGGGVLGPGQGVHPNGAGYQVLAEREWAATRL